MRSEQETPRVRDLVSLDPDHPGFRDPTYRARRNAIAQIALDYRSGDPIPDAPYSEEEQEVWRLVWKHLRPLHERRVCAELLELQRALDLGSAAIPQLGEINVWLERATGFRMEPVAGLVAPRAFLSRLGRGVMLSTQYIRHASRPFYTPEPDIVHELVGHAASLTDGGIAEVSRQLGRAAIAATGRELGRLERAYWYTIEFGVVEERGEPKAFGAGLLSSYGELEQLDQGPELLPWDLARMAETDYDPTRFQPALFVAPSFDRLLGDLSAWLARGEWRE